MSDGYFGPDVLRKALAGGTERAVNYSYFYATGARRAISNLLGHGRDRSRTQQLHGLSSPEAFILHCPAPQRARSNPFRRVWVDTCARYFADETLRARFSDPEDLTILTYNNKPEAGLLERSLEFLGLTRYVVVGRGVETWTWLHKVSLVLDYLDADLCETTHLMCLDGDDVLVVDDPALALDRFEESGSELLFAGTRGNQPSSPECWEFENSVPEYRDPRHRHLNAGGYIGKTSYIQARLREIVAAGAAGESWCFSRYGFDDQLAWRQMHRHRYPEIKVDADCRIFVRFDEDR